MKTYSLYSEKVPSFSDILTIDSVPEGPFASLILLQTVPVDSNEKVLKSLYLVCHPYYQRSVMREAEMFVIFDYLKANGYKLESDIKQYYPNKLIDFLEESTDSYYSFDKTKIDFDEKKDIFSNETKKFICKFSYQ